MNKYLLLLPILLFSSCVPTLIDDDAIDEEQETMMSVYTEFAYAIQDTYATSGGSVSSPWSEVTSRGVCWSTEEDPTIEDSHTVDTGNYEDFISQLTDLTPATKYYVRAYGINKYGIEYGRKDSFTTLDKLEPSCETEENNMFFNLQTFTFNNYESGEDETIYGSYGYSATGSNGDITIDFGEKPKRGKYSTTNNPSDLDDPYFKCYISGTFGFGSAFWQSKSGGEVNVEQTEDGKTSITFCNVSFGAGGGFNLNVDGSYGNLIFE